jgi:hypothetical protein
MKDKICTTCNQTKPIIEFKKRKGVTGPHSKLLDHQLWRRCNTCADKPRETTHDKIQNEKKYHFVYKITNTVNEMYYYGKQSTNNVNDDYRGSGYAIKIAHMLYGKDKFHKEVIHLCESSQDAYALEETIVTAEMIDDPLCLNMTTGGRHGTKRAYTKKYVDIVKQYTDDRDINLEIK